MGVAAGAGTEAGAGSAAKTTIGEKAIVAQITVAQVKRKEREIM
jgi:hypothetical protein